MPGGQPRSLANLLRSRSVRDAALLIGAGVVGGFAFAYLKGEDWRHGVRFALGYAAFMILVVYARRRRPAGRRSGSKIELRPNPAGLVIMAVPLAASFAVFAYACYRDPKGAAFIPLLVVFALLSIGMCAAVARWRCRVDTHGVDTRSLLGKVTHVPWASVRDVESYVWRQKGFSHQMLKLVTGTAKIEVPCSFDGAGDFARLALEHLPQEVLAGRPKERAILESLAREYAEHSRKRRVA